MGYRRQVSSSLYYLRPLVDYFRPSPTPAGGEPPLDYLRVVSHSDDPYLEFLRVFRETRGWMPENDPRGSGVYASECDIPVPKFFNIRTLSYKSYLEDVLDSYADLAKRHNATLVIVFQPVACVLATGGPSAEARIIVDRFKREHPDVEIPFPLIETWPVDLFSVPAHVRHEYTDLLGDRLGKAFAEIVMRHGD